MGGEAGVGGGAGTSVLSGLTELLEEEGFDELVESRFAKFYAERTGVCR
jgi:hypothetical protein